ncbi:uncharacterized protein LOC119588709 [Penaeus monodon]|uniref:uncharacterized protein LOC119588709 n=1 Tax=Penaeus monodon TaxID=6687 RepID=UPI0018A72895|nr:uncharacterized protein LOC119588709 [Penaeus monodon]
MNPKSRRTCVRLSRTCGCQGQTDNTDDQEEEDDRDEQPRRCTKTTHEIETTSQIRSPLRQIKGTSRARREILLSNRANQEQACKSSRRCLYMVGKGGFNA